jgi:hypothetical protein
MAKHKNDAPAPQPPAVQPTSDNPEVVRANVNRETFLSSGFTSLYANDTQIQISPWDFRLMFGVISEAPSLNNLTYRIEMVGEVRMSPQHAKRVAEILERQLKLYEESIGPIPTPD